MTAAYVASFWKPAFHFPEGYSLEPCPIVKSAFQWPSGYRWEKKDEVLKESMEGGLQARGNSHNSWHLIIVH